MNILGIGRIADLLIGIQKIDCRVSVVIVALVIIVLGLACSDVPWFRELPPTVVVITGGVGIFFLCSIFLKATFKSRKGGMKEYQLDKIMEHLIDEAYHLRVVFCVWRILNDSTDEINQHRECIPFFQIVKLACYQYLFISVSKFFDKGHTGKETASLYSLKNALENENKTTTMAKINNFLRDATTRKRMVEIRNQHFAHLDMSKRQLTGGIKLDNVSYLIEKTCEIINQVAGDISYHENKRIPNTQNNKYQESTRHILSVL